MKLFTKIILATTLSFLSFQGHAQWTLDKFPTTDISLVKNVNGNIFVDAFNDTTFTASLYMSPDNGVTWNLADSISLRVGDMTYDSAHSVYIAVAQGNYGVFYSTDGLNWKNPKSLWGGDGIAYIHNQSVLSDDLGGAAISTDGGLTWNVSNSGLDGPFYIHYLTRIGDTLILANQGAPCFISTNYGASWQNHSDSDIYFTNCFFQHKGVTYAGLYLNGTAYYSGGHWTYDSTGLATTIDVLALADAGDTLFCGGDSIGVWMTTNGIWTDFSCGFPAKMNVEKLLRVGNTLLAGTDQGLWSYDLGKACSINSVENAPAPSLDVYPTITAGVVNIYSGRVPEMVQVMDMEGRIIRSNANTTLVDLHSYPSGMYFLAITLPNREIVMRKIVRE